MPRTRRKRSETGIYHIMLREINGQVIFCDEEDYQYFITSLSKKKKDQDVDDKVLKDAFVDVFNRLKID